MVSEKSEGLGLTLELTTSNRKRNILRTTLGNNAVNVTFFNIYQNIPTILPNPETQRFLAKLHRKIFIK